MMPHGHASRAVTDATSGAKTELAHSLYMRHCRETLPSPLHGHLSCILSSSRTESSGAKILVYLHGAQQGDANDMLASSRDPRYSAAKQRRGMRHEAAL